MRIPYVITGITIAALSSFAGTRDIPQTASKDQAEAAAAGVLAQVEALKRLRRSDTAGAIELLETSLDANVTILRGNDEVRRDPRVTKILERAAEYRSAYPRKSDPVLDSHVSELLRRYKKGAQ